MRTHVEHLDDVVFLIELVCEQQLLGTSLEFHDANACESARFGLASQGIGEKAPNSLVNRELGGSGQFAF
jgi:hypothetical protein